VTNRRSHSTASFRGIRTAAPCSCAQISLANYDTSFKQMGYHMDESASPSHCGASAVRLSLHFWQARQEHTGTRMPSDFDKQASTLVFIFRYHLRLPSPVTEAWARTENSSPVSVTRLTTSSDPFDAAVSSRGQMKRPVGNARPRTASAMTVCCRYASTVGGSGLFRRTDAPKALSEAIPAARCSLW
jgi:hypothetical protein